MFCNTARVLQQGGKLQTTHMAVARWLYEVQLWPSIVI